MVYMCVWCCVSVEYSKNQDPYLLRTWQYNCSGPTMITLSPDARTVALASSATVSVYNVTSDECVATLQDVFSSKPLWCTLWVKNLHRCLLKLN